VVTIVLANPFAGGPTSSAGRLDNGVPTSTVSVTRRYLSSQTHVSATLGYADATTIAVSTGTAPSNGLTGQPSAYASEPSMQKLSSR